MHDIAIFFLLLLRLVVSHQAPYTGMLQFPGAVKIDRLSITCNRFMLLILLNLIAIKAQGLDLQTENRFIDTTSPVVEKSNTSRIDSVSIETPIDIRLPRSVLPIHYNIRLLPHFENFTVDGYIDILVKCQEDTSKITLHSVDIDIDKSSIKVVGVSNTGDLKIANISRDIDREFLVISLGKNRLIKGRTYRISMEFTSYLNDRLRGFYRSSYVESGQKKWIAVTQFQPTDARRAFPCFDEPNMKAEFTVTLGRKEKMISLSNTLVQQTTDIIGKPGYKWDHYKTTVPMSNYLVAFVVCKFEYILASKPHSSPVFRIWARPSAINQTEYAGIIGPKILRFFENYFNISYPLEKQDMIAVPDFAMGAMENWGLVTYRETTLLYDPKLAGVSSKQSVAATVAHELAHQWFGNLVTMDWWSDLWLNEGFASYVQYLGVQEVEPELKVEQQFVTETVQSVFQVDALESSHAISVPVQHPDEINEIFDQISYNKGASLIRMLDGFLGKETFTRGLTRYLTSRKFGNAVQDDLWKTLDDQAAEDGVDLPVSAKTIMDTWTLKKGFPVVTVTRNYETGTAEIRQNRFLHTRNTSSTKDDATVYTWWIPITYTQDFKEIHKQWLPDNSSSKSIYLHGIASNQPVIFNIEEIGYYRVNYDERNWQLIQDQLLIDLSKIHTNNRAQIMDDSFNLARAGQLHYHTALNLTRYLKKETEYIPWYSALTALSYIDTMLQRTPEYRYFRLYVEDLVQPLFDSVGFSESPDDPPLTIYKRVNVLHWICSLGIKSCVRNATKLYAEWMKDTTNPEIISPNLKKIVACTAIREGGTDEWDAAFERYKTSNVAIEKLALLSALTCTREPWLLSTLLEWSLNPESGIRKQDALTLYRLIPINPLGRYMAFDFFRNRWTDIRNYFPEVALSRTVESVTSSLNTKPEVNQLKRFTEENIKNLASAKGTFEQASEIAEANLQWMTIYYPVVAKWLTTY